ncbi:unnamed protein product [Phytophthora lilii]|uniref:Unnamed protein product n=1 Tax=Phytophthora lilii TaxID=2077276 RepID=A0A9W6TUU7_9STRA|nr:unnamed protein product [Phytophthora lilii]
MGISADNDELDAMKNLASSVVGGPEAHDAMLSIVLNRKDRQKASRLYRDSVNGQTRRALRLTMPTEGWLVNAEENTCPCNVYLNSACCSQQGRF